MSNLRVNNITNGDENGHVTFSKGLSISPNKTISADTVSVSGVVTSTFFYGDGFNLTNVPGISNAKGIALTLVT